jgi:hypothetical protein
LARVVVVVVVMVAEALDLDVGEEGFAGEVAFVGDDFVEKEEEDGVPGSGNSLGWFCIADSLSRLHNAGSVPVRYVILWHLRICSL